MRAIGVSHTACKDEFRRKSSISQLECIFVFIICIVSKQNPCFRPRCWRTKTIRRKWLVAPNIKQGLLKTQEWAPKKALEIRWCGSWRVCAFFFFGGVKRASRAWKVTAEKLPRKLPRKLSRKLPRKLPRIRKLPRKNFHGCFGFSFMEVSGSFHGRSEAQRLPRKLSRKFFAKAFEAASTKSWRLHPRNFTFYFHGSFHSFHGILAASTTAPTDICVLHTTVPPVELTTFLTTWLTHTVYETKGVSPYNGCYVSFG